MTLRDTIAATRNNVNSQADITVLLRRWSEGDHSAEDELFAVVLGDLRKLAQHMMNGERRNHSMQASELVDEVYLKLAGSKNIDWRSRRHFFAIAARAMRRYLIDHARGRPRAEFVAIDDLAHGLADAKPGDLELAIAIDALLEDLAKIHPDWCHVVEIKYFLGLTDEEAADALGIKLRTLQRTWSDARQWLYSRISSYGSNSANSGGSE